LNIHAIALGGGFQALAAITGVEVVRRIEQRNLDQQLAVSGLIEVLERTADFDRWLGLLAICGRGRMPCGKECPMLVRKTV